MSSVIKTVFVVVCLLMLGTHASAASAPVIDQLDVLMLDGKVHVTLNWRSEAPVTEINISGGKDVQVVKEKITTFRTSMGGYRGRHSQIVDSNFVTVQRAYRTEHASSQYLRQGNTVAASSEASRTSEPIQEVIVVTVWLTDKYGNVSERKEKQIPKTIDGTLSPVPVQSQTAQSGVSATAAGGRQPGTWEALLVEFGADLLRKPRVLFNSVVPSADGTITVTASAIAVKSFTQFVCRLHDPATNNVIKESLFECSVELCRNKTVTFTGLTPGSYQVQISAVDSSSQEAKGTYSSLVTVPAVNAAPTQSAQPEQSTQPVANVSLQP